MAVLPHGNWIKGYCLGLVIDGLQLSRFLAGVFCESVFLLLLEQTFSEQ